MAEEDALKWALVCPAYGLFLTHIRRHDDISIEPHIVLPSCTNGKGGALVSNSSADETSTTALTLTTTSLRTLHVEDERVQALNRMVPSMLARIGPQYDGVCLARVQAFEGGKRIILLGRLQSVRKEALHYCPCYGGYHRSNKVVLDLGLSGLRIRCFSHKATPSPSSAPHSSAPHGPPCEKIWDQQKYTLPCNEEDRTRWKCIIQQLAGIPTESLKRKRPPQIGDGSNSDIQMRQIERSATISTSIAAKLSKAMQPKS